MAEFCLPCYNRIYESQYLETQVQTRLGHCEACGAECACVVSLRPKGPVARVGLLLKKWWPRPTKGEEPHTLDMQTAYIHVFGAAGAALDALSALPQTATLPEVEAARRILEKAIAETEEYVELH